MTDPLPSASADIERMEDELQALRAELAARNSAFGERIEHQAATIEVLKAMSASPGDAQPVFDLIARQAAKLCNVPTAAVATFDGTMIYLATQSGFDAAYADAYVSQFPRPVGLDSAMGRAILNQRVEQVEDITVHPGHSFVDVLGHWSVMAVPISRDGVPLGAITIGRSAMGPFSDSQVALLQTFAEQAVIAISSAETYRALQTRTADLQESLEYQTATSDVLKVISRSAFDLQPILDTVVMTAAQLCGAEMAAIGRREGNLFRLVAQLGFPSDFVADRQSRGARYLDKNGVTGRAVFEGRVIHVQDAASEADYPEDAVRVGKQRTSLGVPLLRDNEVIGVLLLARQRVEPFTDRQIDLVRTFADQAVIAIENTRLITEQREALEQQTATAEVLQVINASAGDLAPVFEAILEKAHNLCGAAIGALVLYDGEYFQGVATHGFPEEHAELVRQPHTSAFFLSPLVRGERLVHIHDLKAAESGPHDALRRSHLETAKTRTALLVPLRKDGQLLGFISAYRLEVRPFLEKEIALLENFAAQAVIAMENARLLTEQREALEQQTATAEVLQVINASPGDLPPVFDAMLEKAMRLCEADCGVIRTYDGEQHRSAAHRGVPPALLDFLRRPVQRVAGGWIDQIIRGAALLHIEDVTADALYQQGNPNHRAYVELGGARSMLWAALRKEDALLGVFGIYRREVRPFTEKQIALLQNFAAQAVIAIDNARLLTETREALEQQTATAEVLQVINASPGDLVPVFDAMLEKATLLCEAPRGQLATFDGEYFRFVAVHGDAGFSEGQFAQGAARPEIGVTWPRIVAGEQVIHMVDVVDTDLYRAGHEGARRFVEVGRGRTLLTVALRKDDLLLGALTVYRQEVRPFTDKQIALLKNFAAQAVIAMENARLIDEQREALEQQTATAEVLQVINASPGDLGPVFDTMLEKAMRLCEAAFSLLYTYVDHRWDTVATRGVPAAFAESSTKYRVTGAPGGPTARLLETKRPVHILDMRAESIYQSGQTRARALVEQGGARTVLFVPLLKDETVLGAIVIYRQEVRAFSDKQIALVENFAAQAVIAMESARLLHELRARTDELAQRQAELRVTFENMGDGVAMFDEAPRLVAWNRKFQEIFAVPDALLEEHRTYADYIRYLAERGDYGAGADPEEEIRRLTEHAGEHHAYERIRPDGRVIEIRHNPVPSGGFVLIFSDITERKRSEAEIRAARDAAVEASRTIDAAFRELKAAQANLIQAEKMASLGQLTAGIAHEIKNPLNFVNNFAELSVDLLAELKEAAAPGFATLPEGRRAEVEDVSATLTSNLEKITEHGRRADGIVKSMLEHSRGTSGERRTVDLNTLVDEALNLAYHGARAQDQSFSITLDRDFGDRIAAIEVSPQDITRVFLNLLSNGFYATSRRARRGTVIDFEPTLKVTTRDLGDQVEIRVRDNGTGIPSDIRDKLFQPFFTTKPTGEGTGLGLSISYDIITQQHGGTITVDSRVGDYTEFVVTLPRRMSVNDGGRG